MDGSSRCFRKQEHRSENPFSSHHKGNTCDREELSFQYRKLLFPRVPDNTFNINRLAAADRFLQKGMAYPLLAFLLYGLNDTGGGLRREKRRLPPQLRWVPSSRVPPCLGPLLSLAWAKDSSNRHKICIR